MKLKNSLVIIMLVIVQFGFAQTADNKFAIGINGMSTKYVGDLGGNAITDFTYSQYVLGYFGAGLSLNMYVNPSFDLGLNGNYGLYGAYHSNSKKFISTKFESSLFGHYKFNNGYIMSKDSKWSPFLSLGVGFATYGQVQDYPNWADYSGADVIIPLGLGIKYQITDKLAVQYQYNYNITTGDKRDKVIAGGNDAFGEHLLGVVFSLGKNKDTDKDGVSDKNDLCPNTPINVKVDEKGCPIDTDKDGVADYMDKCPNSMEGERVDANGCALDSDKDGVADKDDRCPNTPAGVKVDSKGCTIVEVVKDKDCITDKDGDGIADYLDKCPDVKGTLENKGCPGVSEETQKVFNQALQGIQFKTNSHEIKPISNPILNNVVDVLKKNSQYTKIDVNGHTDSTGPDEYNMTLSQKRAEEVKKYLVTKGIDAARLSPKGFGESQPAADNTTPEGRYKNRRVDFKVNF